MDRKFNSCSEPDIWGGIECTINRTGDHFRDQLAMAGHYDRPEDMLRFVQLGIKKMRYPVLWERHAPVENHVIDWSVTERNLEVLWQHQVEPIAGLVHHGSGPRYTNLLDPDFGKNWLNMLLP